jgi:hypothetical protein
VVMDADTVEACLFAADDERGKIRQGPGQPSDASVKPASASAVSTCESASGAKTA